MAKVRTLSIFVFDPRQNELQGCHDRSNEEEHRKNLTEPPLVVVDQGDELGGETIGPRIVQTNCPPYCEYKKPNDLTNEVVSS